MNVEHVHDPDLESHPQHTLAKRQMTGLGGMISFEPKGGEIAAHKILKATRLFVLAESLGGVESLISCPYTMTHASLTKDPRMKTRTGKDLIRLSVGIEDKDDLIEDLGQALQSMRV